jgi:hypothetical protein
VRTLHEQESHSSARVFQIFFIFTATKPKIMKHLFLFFFVALLAAPVMAQDDDISIPENYLLKKPEHYKEYEPMVANCCKWLMNNKVDHQPDRRIKAYSFIWDWMSGHPDITITIYKNLVTFNKKNPDLLIMFMVGYTLEAIENEDKTEFDTQLAGVNAMLNCYTKNRPYFKKDKTCEKMLKMKAASTLKDYVRKNI